MISNAKIYINGVLVGSPSGSDIGPSGTKTVPCETEAPKLRLQGLRREHQFTPGTDPLQKWKPLFCVRKVETCFCNVEDV